MHIVKGCINELLQNQSSPCSIVAVDATCGNGHDTLSLAKILTAAQTQVRTPAGYRLYAFDIQEGAIQSTEQLLIRNGFQSDLKNGSIVLVQDSHENLAAVLPGSAPASGPGSTPSSAAGLSTDSVPYAHAVIFNLGYLPGGGKEITTEPESTLKAVQAALDILAKDGIICITMYSGHAAGANEKAQLLDFARGLDSREFHVAYISMTNQPNNPPEILLITRK